LLPLAPLALLLAGGVALSARDAPRAFRVGLSASLAQPLAANCEFADMGLGFKDCLSTGVSLAGAIEWGLGANSAIRARAEYLSLGGKDSLRGYDELDFDVILPVVRKLGYDFSAVALGADYLYSFSSNEDGAYVFGGIGYYVTSGSGSLGRSVLGNPSAPIALEGSGDSPGVSLGAGLRYTRSLAAELRFSATSGLRHKVDGSALGSAIKDDADIGLSWIQVGLCYRF
jgi:hypothetical protein